MKPTRNKMSNPIMRSKKKVPQTECLPSIPNKPKSTDFSVRIVLLETKVLNVVKNIVNSQIRVLGAKLEKTGNLVGRNSVSFTRN